MNFDAIGLLAEHDRQALADRLALELMRPVPEWSPVDQCILLPRNRFELPPAPPVEDGPSPTRPVGPRGTRFSKSIRKTRNNASVDLSSTPEAVRVAPFTVPRQARNDSMRFERGAFDAESAVQRALEGL